MKKIRLLLTCCALSLNSMVVNPASASGIPTVDIAALVQKLISYSQQLADHAEQLYQSQVNANEYIQKLRQIEQIFIEYEHTLDQIEGIEAYVNQDEWGEILDIVYSTFPSLPLSQEWGDWSPFILEDENVAEVDATIASQHERIRELDEVYADIDEAFSSEDLRAKKKEDARKLYYNSRKATEQKYATTVFTEQAEQLDTAFSQLKTYRKDNAVGNQSQLRTLQTMSMQAELELEYQKSQNEVLIKSLELANQEVIGRKNRQSYIYDAQLRDQLEKANRAPYEPTDRDWTVNF